MKLSLPLSGLTGLLFLVFYSTAFAQQPLPSVWTAEYFMGKLHPNSIYDIEVDSTGMIYMARNGLFYFNGTDFRSVRRNTQLRDQNFIAIHKDLDGRLWVKATNGELLYLEGDSAVTYHPAAKLDLLADAELESMHRDENGTLHFGFRNYGYYTLSKSGEVTAVVDTNSGIDGFGIIRVGKHDFPLHFHVNQTSAEGESMNVYWFDSPEKHRVLFLTKYPYPIAESTLLPHEDGTFTFSTGNQSVYRFTENELLKAQYYDYRIGKLFEDSRGNLWLGTSNNGIWRASRDDLRPKDHMYAGKTSAVLAEDSFGGLWMRVPGLGFACMPYPHTRRYGKDNGFPQLERTAHITTDGEKVFCLFERKNELLIIEGDSMHTLIPPLPVQLPPTEKVIYPYSCSYDKVNGYLYLSFSTHIARWDGKEWTNYLFDREIFHERQVTWCLRAMPDGSVIGSSRTRMFRLKDGVIEPFSESRSRGEYIYEFHIDPKGTTWVGCMDGLWKLDGQKFVRPMEPMPASLTKRIRFLFAAPGKPEEIWLQSIDSKLSRLTSDSLEPIQWRDGSTFRIADNLKISSDEVWLRLAHEGRLSHWKHTADGLEQQGYAYDELGGNRIFQNNFAVTREYVYLGSQVGTFRERLSELKPPLSLPKTLIWKVLVSDSLQPLQTSYQLAHDQNQLEIKFEGLSFRRRPLEFEYRMVGFDTVWHSTENNSIQFTNLEPGDYQFEVRTGIRHVGMGEPVTVSFHIATPFWETWWFRSIGLLVLIAGIYGIVLLRTRQVRQREQAKSEIALEMSRLELRALKAQINPHFIFNSISSVQYYLTKNQPEDAESYLQRFAELIRSVLENSERHEVSLAEELGLMRHYVGLESERFAGAAIEFLTETDGIDPKKVMIPPTLIQPYIENAIWHGLKPKQGQRTILIQATQKNDQLFISIEDNGIGRAAARERESLRKGGRSFGMMIASRRVEIINQENKHPVEVHDLIDPEGQPTGTRIELTLPFKSEA